MKFSSTPPEEYCNIKTDADNCEYGACGDYSKDSEGCKIILGDDDESKSVLKCENVDH